MTRKEFRFVPCIDCQKPVPCLSTRMRRCQECMYAHNREVHIRVLEENERELIRL